MRGATGEIERDIKHMSRYVEGGPISFTVCVLSCVLVAASTRICHKEHGDRAQRVLNRRRRWDPGDGKNRFPRKPEKLGESGSGPREIKKNVETAKRRRDLSLLPFKETLC